MNKAGKLDLGRRHRPVLFLVGYSFYLVPVFIFPYLLTYAVHSKYDYSRLAVYINWMGILIDGGTLGLGRALQQLAIQTPEEELRKRLPVPLQGALAVLGALLGGLTAAFALAALARPGWFEGSLAIAFWLWLAVALGLARLSCAFLVYGLRRYGWYTGIDVAWALARLAVIPAAWRLAGLRGVLAGNALLYGAALAASLAVVARGGIAPAWGPWRKALGEIRYFLKFGFWMHLAWLAPQLAQRGSVLLVAGILGRNQEPVGLAHLSFSVLTAAAILLDSFFLSLYPEKARAGVEGRRGELAAWAGQEARALGFLLWPAALAAAWLTGLPVALLPAEYRGLAAWLGPIALALPARAMAAPLVTALQAGHRPAVGALYQGLRLVTDLAGIAVSLVFWQGAGAAPAWGLLAGEWVATAALFLIQLGRGENAECGMRNVECGMRNEKSSAGVPPAVSLADCSNAECGKKISDFKFQISNFKFQISKSLAAALRAWGLIGLMFAWTAGVEALARGRSAGLRWGIWLGLSAGWYLVLPLLGVADWAGVRMTFTPQRGETETKQPQ